MMEAGLWAGQQAKLEASGGADLGWTAAEEY
jgi:hypothetical protein